MRMTTFPKAPETAPAMDKFIDSLRIVWLLAAAAAAGLALGLLLAMSVANAQAPEDDLETVEIGLSAHDRDLLDRIEAYLNGISAFRARFVQMAPSGEMSAGTMHFARPGRVRFEYDGDKPLLIVSDGELLSFIDYQVGQVTRWPVTDTPLAPLLAESVDFDSDVTLLSGGRGALANIIAVTASDPDQPNQGSLTLYFLEREGRAGAPALTLTSWEVVDAQGLLTTITLSDIDEAPELAESLWSFDDPRGATFERRPRRR